MIKKKNIFETNINQSFLKEKKHIHKITDFIGNQDGNLLINDAKLLPNFMDYKKDFESKTDINKDILQRINKKINLEFIKREYDIHFGKKNKALNRAYLDKICDLLSKKDKNYLNKRKVFSIESEKITRIKSLSKKYDLENKKHTHHLSKRFKSFLKIDFNQDSSTTNTKSQFSSNSKIENDTCYNTLSSNNRKSNWFFTSTNEDNKENKEVEINEIKGDFNEFNHAIELKSQNNFISKPWSMTQRKSINILKKFNNDKYYNKCYKNSQCDFAKILRNRIINKYKKLYIENKNNINKKEHKKDVLYKFKKSKTIDYLLPIKTILSKNKDLKSNKVIEVLF